MENQDYVIVSEEIMNIFKAYKGYPIKKRAYKLANGQKRVELYKKKFKYFFLSQKICHSIDMGRPKLT
jgi:hypothetical protein